jgi:pSer/pThr/pTyr-binding forkhead associated (FHA) protein
MPKIMLMGDDGVVSEWAFNGKEALIGRGDDCAVRLDDPSVSRHHAKVARIRAGYFIEDLQSTNGVVLNGRRVRKHMLKDGDVLQIGTHNLRFVADATSPESVVDVASPLDQPQPAVRTVRLAARAFVKVLNGPDEGDSRQVDKSLYTIGEPGGNLAVISRRGQGHYLLHLGGKDITTLNGEQVHGGGVALQAGDVIQVGETRFEFLVDS